MNADDLKPMNKVDDHEASMARADLYKLANYSFKLFKMIKEGQELEGWVQAKVTKAADYIASVYHYMEYEMKFSEYGEQLENSDVYNESLKQELRKKLSEARVKLEKLKDIDEGKADDYADKRKEEEDEDWWGDKKKKNEKKSAVTKVKGRAYGGSAQDDDDDDDDDDKPKKKSKKSVKEDEDGASAAPSKGKDGKYPLVTSGPHKGKRWSPTTMGPTNLSYLTPDERKTWGKNVKEDITTTRSSVSGKMKMGKPSGPIEYNGKTVNPGDPEYAAASKALIQFFQKKQQRKLERATRNKQ